MKRNSVDDLILLILASTIPLIAIGLIAILIMVVIYASGYCGG